MGSSRSYGNRNKSKRPVIRSNKPYYSPSGTITIVRGTDFLPQKLINSMEYQEQVFMTAVAQPFNYVWRGNGAFDPNQTGTGNGCLGFSTMTSIYTQYECPSSVINVEYINNAAVPVWISVVPVNTAVSVNLNNEVGMPGSKRVYCTSNKDIQHASITSSSSSYKILNLIPGSGETKANVTTNPNSQWYWSVNIYSCDNATAISGVLNVYIKYKTIWSGRKVI